MSDETVERKTLHCLRHRPTGLLLRVAEDVSLLATEPYRSEETCYRLTLDEGHPIFDAGSLDALAIALHPTYGSSPQRPIHDGFRAQDLEAVVLRETLSRSISPADVTFDMPVRIDSLGILEVRPGLARSVDGLAAVLEAVAEHREATEAMMTPGGEYPWGSYALVGHVLARDADLPEDVAGTLILPGRHAAPARRALATLDIPGEVAGRLVGSDVLPAYPILLVCLSDARSLPEELVEALGPHAGPRLG